VTDNFPAPSVFEFDLAVFRLEAIKKAAYRFAGAFTVEVEKVSDSRVRVTLSLCQRQPKVNLDPNRLPNEVLDQELREVVAEETKSVRDLLLAQTFSGISLVDPVGENADYRDDPLSISERQITEAAAANLHSGR
jgi:His-Xaa-Ser system protein HxsD